MFLRRFAMIVLACAVAVFPLAGTMAHDARKAAKPVALQSAASQMHGFAHAQTRALAHARHGGHAATAHQVGLQAHEAVQAGPVADAVPLKPADFDGRAGTRSSHASSCCDGAPCFNLALCTPCGGVGLRLRPLVMTMSYAWPLPHVAPGVPERPPRSV